MLSNVILSVTVIANVVVANVEGRTDGRKTGRVYRTCLLKQV